MNRNLNRKRLLALLVAALHLATSPLGIAATTDLSNTPLANVSGTTAVKPNIMFLLDNSGSMDWDFTPDWVYTTQGAGSTTNCFDSKDDDGNLNLTAPGGYSLTASSLNRCEIGDPPYMSTNFNRQYYNPAIRYLPGVTADGSEMSSQNAANTANWTQVATDPFGVQRQDQRNNTVTTTDIVGNYPDRVWCTTQADAATDSSLCKKNSAYAYPDRTFGYGLTAGGSIKYVGGNPYYYTIGVSEYCATEDLQTCQPTQDAGHPFPAVLRWCTDSGFTSCQAKRTGTFTYPKVIGNVADVTGTIPGVAATGRITVGNSGSGTSVSITGITIGGAGVMDPTATYSSSGVTLAGGVITAATGTDNSSERTAVASAIALAITSSSGYTATAAGAVVTITATTAGAAPNGRPIVVTAPGTGIASATYVLNIANVASAATPVTVTGIVVNGVQIMGGPVSCLRSWGSNNTARRAACATAVAASIQGYTSTPDYTATASGADVTISAPLAEGASANGRPGTASGTALNPNPTNFNFANNGVSLLLPTTVVNMANGADATTGTVRLRTNVAPFSRTDILPGNNYPKYPARGDCVDTFCSYAEEMTNFANWYAYYRTRMQMMKAAAGRSFRTLTSDYRVGFSTIYINSSTTLDSNQLNSNNSNNGIAFTRIRDFDSSQRDTWYTTFYAQEPYYGTPLRTALDRIGRHYQHANSSDDDPVQYSCQQNFTILTTDGYWNDSYSGVGNQDNFSITPDPNPAKPPYCSQSIGCWDGNATSNTLADVALYYYKNDLRTGAGWDEEYNNVPTSTQDPNPAQHMTTFTLGLGVDGLLNYQSNYTSATSGHFYEIKTGSRNWPVPVANTQTAVDDLWHAAVNGHGTYFSAQDPAALSDGLNSALTGIKVRNGAAAASATSTPNVTQEDNDIFSATFRTVQWDGELVAQKIDTATGNLLPTINWAAQALLDDKVGNTTDSRTLYTLDASGSTPLRKFFTWNDLTASERAYFENKCAGANQLTQCTGFDAAQKALANNGEKMVEYLRGRKEMENTVPEIYRDRDHTLGDIASAKPAYVRNPRRNYGDTGYSTYKAAQSTRQAMVYVAANDGMLHALNATTGDETWAYVPRMLLPDLYRLADTNYQNNHRYFVDGSPESGDVFINGAWRTILVGGLNKGGRGYYALDITDPANPLVLWEICADAALCGIVDSDLGYTFGNPIITKLQGDGRWVVVFTSGYNNVSPGDGKGYFYVVDAADGTLLHKISTNVGDTITPSGLARITGLALNAQTDNTASYVYGGDLLGNLWRLDMGSRALTKLASLTDFTGVTQPITTRPELGLCDSQVMVFTGTGRYLGNSDLTDTQRQTMYGIKDSTVSYGTFRTSSAVQQSFSPQGGGTYTITDNNVNLAAVPGWYVDFDQNSGERVNLDPALVFGNLLVITNQPTDISTCSTGGNSYKYEFNYCTGSYLQAAPNQQVGTKLGSSIVVGFIVIRLPSGALKVVTTFASGEKTTSGVTGGTGGKVRRVSWRELTQ